MYRLIVAQRSYLLGDEATDLLFAYAALLPGAGQSAHVPVHVIGSDGDELTARLLLSQGTVLIAEPVTSTRPEPDNTELVLHIRERLRYFGALPGDGHWPGSVLP